MKFTLSQQTVAAIYIALCDGRYCTWRTEKITRRYFVKHRGKQKEIILADKRDFEIGITLLFKLKRGVHPAKPAGR